MKHSNPMLSVSFLSVLSVLLFRNRLMDRLAIQAGASSWDSLCLE